MAWRGAWKTRPGLEPLEPRARPAALGRAQPRSVDKATTATLCMGGRERGDNNAAPRNTVASGRSAPHRLGLLRFRSFPVLIFRGAVNAPTQVARRGAELNSAHIFQSFAMQGNYPSSLLLPPPPPGCHAVSWRMQGWGRRYAKGARNKPCNQSHLFFGMISESEAGSRRKRWPFFTSSQPSFEIIPSGIPESILFSAKSGQLQQGH